MAFQQYTGFTLSEVLVTLGIIGVVAAMTIPTVLSNMQTQQTVSSLKKAYSTLSQAYTQAVNDNGTPENWNLIGVGDQDGALNILNIMAPYLKLNKKCDKGQGCWPNVTYKHLSGNPWANLDSNGSLARMQISDGLLIAFQVKDKDCHAGTFPAYYGTSLALQNVCGNVFVDINGFKNPNQEGIDVFQFYLSKYGVIPYGTGADTISTFDLSCKTKPDGANACTAWVIYNENMDYLKCGASLSWSGQSKCP